MQISLHPGARDSKKMALSDLTAALEALDARIAVLAAAVKGGYSIDGQSVGETASVLKTALESRKELADAVNAAQGCWELEDRVVT